MNYLLDTHTLIWFINGDSELSDKARKLIGQKNANNYVSIASLWEIAIKLNLGKLQMRTAFSTFPEQLSKNGFQILPISFEDTLKLASLTLYHRDPFDRLLVVQGITNNLKIITKDKLFENYDVTTVW